MRISFLTNIVVPDASWSNIKKNLTVYSVLPRPLKRKRMFGTSSSYLYSKEVRKKARIHFKLQFLIAPVKHVDSNQSYALVHVFLKTHGSDWHDSISQKKEELTMIMQSYLFHNKKLIYHRLNSRHFKNAMWYLCIPVDWEKVENVSRPETAHSCRRVRS